MTVQRESRTNFEGRHTRCIPIASNMGIQSHVIIFVKDPVNACFGKSSEAKAFGEELNAVAVELAGRVQTDLSAAGVADARKYFVGKRLVSKPGGQI